MSEGTPANAAAAAPTAGARPPVWVWPSIAMGLLYPALARSARLDVELLERLPDPPTNLRRLPSAYAVLLVGGGRRAGHPLLVAAHRHHRPLPVPASSPRSSTTSCATA